MIRNQELLYKLIADLHFHKFLFVDTRDNIFIDWNEHIDSISKCLKTIGLNKQLDPSVDFYHGGTVSTPQKNQFINNYIDDVFLDFFFRTHHFEEIIIPKDCYPKQITPNGVTNSTIDINLNLNNIYDRCTFVFNMYRLFGPNGLFLKIFNDKFIGCFYSKLKNFGLHSECFILKNIMPFHFYFDEYIEKKNRGNYNIDPISRGNEIKKFIQFIQHESEHEIMRHSISLIQLHDFRKGYLELADKHFFGNYTIEDILFLYSLLTDKFIINEDSFLLSLCFCIKREHNIRILDDFISFENQYQDYHKIEPFIIGNDLYLRFASHTKSRAFSFTYFNEVIGNIYLFNKKSTKIIRHSNTIPLPYLYSKLSLV